VSGTDAQYPSAPGWLGPTLRPVGKRKALALAAAAAPCGLAAGGLIGFIGHAPARAATWAGARPWLTFAAVMVGVPAALYQLNLQRRQFAGQQRAMEEEAGRNRGRDLLLHGQIGELRQRYLAVERQQAEQVGFAWEDTETSPMGVVVNNSARPIRDVACILFPGGQKEAVLACRTVPMSYWEIPHSGVSGFCRMRRQDAGHRVPVIAKTRRTGALAGITSRNSPPSATAR
jgi:hypothetical protein